jgi:DedD protein
MAKTVSDEEIQLRKRARRRLVGAVALVVAAIVILPMLLDSKPEERSQEIDIHIPSEDSAEELGTGAMNRTGTMDTTTVQKLPAGIQQPEPSNPESSVKPVPSMESAAKPADKPTDKPTNKPAEKNADARGGSEDAKSSSSADRFVVQLGAYSSPAKARQQLQSLTSRERSEYLDVPGDTEAKAYTETMKVNKDAEKGSEKGLERGSEKGSDKGSEKAGEKGEITRVRVGPFRTREQAEASREKLKRLGFDGVVADK